LVENSLGEYISTLGLHQLRIAETEKYPHVTYFFSGGAQHPFTNEDRILIDSPRDVATYDERPEMSLPEVAHQLVEAINSDKYDLIITNFANGDMVGHTGVMQAAIKACEAVDTCAKRVIEVALKNGYTTLVIADHGNCETMINPDGTPNTAHTTNPVPIILVDNELKQIRDGVLGDIAPTILDLMGIKKPTAMTCNSLI
jgi:2,3-bisphosphoglycerate-independent phosphoglycerate mutase